MSLERWRQIEEIFHAALERAGAARLAYLDTACGQDSGLRQEVESLLARAPQAESFLESRGPQSTVTMMLNQQIGPYRILAPLGAGGMGEVYRAHDNKLGRDVALKTLPKEFALDAERLARFRREARTLASLNHPNIAAIYGLEESDGAMYLVLELVEGETLRGPLSIEKALECGQQIAEGLEAAHEKGIVHRDLKPANVKVTPKGRVKVLDFGLAKAVWGTEQDRDLSQIAASGTATQLETVVGALVGTPAYMSPEQARGQPVDERADIWAFGCLLYELLTGRRAFQGASLQDTIAAVLEREPDWSALPAKSPAKIRELLRQCLQKDTSRRLPNIADARRMIEQAQRGSNRWPLVAAAAVAIVAAATALLLRNPTRVSDPSRWVQITNFPDSVSQPALSPDGRMLTFVRGGNTFLGPGEIYVKILPSGEPVQLTHDNLSKMNPEFSPDGSRIAYTVLSGRFEWDTWLVPILGGQPQLWLPNASGLSWPKSQELLFSEIKQGEHMAIVTASEGRADERDIYVPPHERGMAHRSYLSPDGAWVLLTEMDNGEWLPCRAVRFNGPGGKPVGPPRALCTGAAWSPDGRWVYVSANIGDGYHLWRQRFPDGKPEQITSGPTEEEGIAITADGSSLITAVGLRQRIVSIHDASGDRQISLEGYSYYPAFSEDGKKLYYRVLKGGGSPFLGRSELWSADLESGRTEPLLPGFDVTGYDLSEDGKRIVFSALDSRGVTHLWVASADRRSPPQRVPNADGDMPYFGPPGELIYHATEGTSTLVFRIHEDGTGKRKVAPQQINEIDGVSQDRRWVVVWSGNGPDGGTYATPIDGGQRVAIFGELCHFRWSRDGKLLYLSVYTGFNAAGAFGRAYVIPLPMGRMFPPVPVGGFRSEAEIAKLPGVRLITAADVAPGLTPDVYAFSRQTTQRNLYRIPIR